MDAQQMHVSFKQGLDKFDSKNYPNIEPEEIDLLLNQAQDTFVKQRYGHGNSKKESFEETQKRTEDLKALIKTQVLSPLPNNINNINSNAVFVQLPEDHWITIQELTNISYPDCNNFIVIEDVYTLAIQHDDYSKLISNPFARPTTGKILRLMTLEGVELIHSSESVVNSYRIRYIKKPARINSLSTPNVNCELSDIVHQEIINIAISIALENIEAKRLPTFIQVTENRQE